jgi:cell division FtsZ-interacting protein ZapD
MTTPVEKYFEQNPHLEAEITNNFISMMKQFNPHRKDMSSADWYSVMIHDYEVLTNPVTTAIQLVPKI